MSAGVSLVEVIGQLAAAFGNRRELEAALGQSDLVPAFERLQERLSSR